MLNDIGILQNLSSFCKGLIVCNMDYFGNIKMGCIICAIIQWKNE